MVVNASEKSFSAMACDCLLMLCTRRCPVSASSPYGTFPEAQLKKPLFGSSPTLSCSNEMQNPVADKGHVRVVLRSAQRKNFKGQRPLWSIAEEPDNV